MKKGLLATTALIGAGALMAGAAGAAEAPTWKLSGGMNFQFYWVDQDNFRSDTAFRSNWNTDLGLLAPTGDATEVEVRLVDWKTGPGTQSQDHDWYFGVDEAELALKVDGVADNGLKYGFKIEIQVNTDDTKVADEARIQLSGSWGTLQLGDEDGAEDTMNYGGENLMGATGGFDGDQGDVLFKGDMGDMTQVELKYSTIGNSRVTIADYRGEWNVRAPGGPSIAGDSSDQTKITYYSPRFSGFQVGASITPTPNDGDGFKEDGDWENHYGLGANYDNTFGGVRIRASAVYSAASSNDTKVEDVGAYSVGGIVGFGPFSVAANYTDNSDSGQPLVNNRETGTDGTVVETSHWNVAASFSTGPMSFAIGYFVGTAEIGIPTFEDSTYEHIALTADYTVAPGLGVYAEVNMISEELIGGSHLISPAFEYGNSDLTNDTTLLILGIKASF